MWKNFDGGMSSTDAGYIDDSRMDGTGDDDKRTGRRADNLVPVMIGHVLSSGSELLLHNTPVRVVTIIGIIRSIDQATTKITYNIEDETGTIKAIKWNSSDDETENREEIIKTGSYARIYGLPREQDGEKHILVLKIFPIKTLNELVSHLLEVVYVVQAGSGSQSSMKKLGNVIDTTSALQNLEFSGMDAEQAAVFKIIRDDESDNGIERSEIKQRLPKPLANKVDEILEFLAGEGHIYTTCTDNHFKAT